MFVQPGFMIPLWFRLWDGNPSRFVLAHVTDTSGVEQFGSPFLLTYSGNRGIYTGVGPLMGNNILVSDYEVYTDSGFTNLDTSYLPFSDWIEPTPMGTEAIKVVVLKLPMKAKVSAPKLKGSALLDVEAKGRIRQDKLKGFISTPKLTGRVSLPEIEESL